MKKLLTGLVVCGLALIVGCPSNSSTTTKSTKTTPSGSTEKMEVKPKTDGEKPAEKPAEKPPEKP